MAIDRIGKGGGVPPSPEPSAQGAGASTGPSKTFSVDRPNPSADAGRVEGAAQANAASPLARLRAGEIDVHGYIDLKVDEATSAMKGLSAEQLDDMKSILRDQMKTDPGLADLVRSATGKMPTPPED